MQVKRIHEKSIKNHITEYPQWLLHKFSYKNCQCQETHDIKAEDYKIRED